jgi:hypothetical protein
MIAILPQRAAVRTSTVPYVVLAVLQVLDVLTTFTILRWFAVGRAEGNPIVAHLFGGVGLAWGCAALLAFKLAVVALFYVCQSPVKIAGAIYGLVIVNNVLLLGLAVLS